MKALQNLVQGSPEWLAERSSRFTASEASVMMGDSLYTKRNELLKQKSSGITPDIEASTQRLFDRGHASEAAARAIAESIIGEDLYPVTAVNDDDWLLASYDGLTLLNDIIWEHKLYGEKLAEQIRAGNLDLHYVWQLEQQILISGADKVLFMCSDGTDDNLEYMWYYPQEGMAEKLIAGWKQFEKDLEAFTPQEIKAEAKGLAPQELMALNIQIEGGVKASNLPAFRDNALAVFSTINRDLKTDQDFADAEKTVKWCKGVEVKLESAKEQAIGQTASIEDLFKVIDSLSSEARATRLELDKLIKAEKANKKVSIATEGKAQIGNHIAGLDVFSYMPVIPFDFNAAMKGKRTIDSLQEASDNLVAKTKIEANEVADNIRKNLAIISEAGENHHLFNDKASLVLRDSDFVAITVSSRIKDEEERKAEIEKQSVKPEPQPETQTEASMPCSPSSPPKIKPQAFKPKALLHTIESYDEKEHLEYFFGDEAISELSNDEDGSEYELCLTLERKRIIKKEAA